MAGYSWIGMFKTKLNLLEASSHWHRREYELDYNKEQPEQTNTSPTLDRMTLVPPNAELGMALMEKE